jgi:hypothetical protein
MENDVVFRKPVESKEVVEDKKEEVVDNHKITSGSDDVETPIALYEQIKGEPYTAKYYEVSKIWNNPDLDMKSDVKAIEKYYVSKVQRNEIADGKDNFKKFIKGLEKAIGVSDLTPNTVKISKLAKYIKFMQEADKIDAKSRR